MTKTSHPSLAPLVRQADYDRYLVALFAPASRREALFALIAFNYELARIADLVSEPMLGEIRLQWWREAIEAIFEDKPVRKHEVTEPLAHAIRRHAIPRAPLDRMIDTRAFDLSEDLPADMAALEEYAEGSAGALSEAMMAVLGGGKPEAVSAARHAGTAWALVGLMRAAPAHAARGRVFLPEDALKAAGIDRGSVLAGASWQALAATVVAPICKRAREHVKLARTARRHLTRAERRALLGTQLTAMYLKQLEAAGHNVALPQKERNVLRPLLRLSCAALLGRY